MSPSCRVRRQGDATAAGSDAVQDRRDRAKLAIDRCLRAQGRSLLHEDPLDAERFERPLLRRQSGRLVRRGCPVRFGSIMTLSDYSDL
jgi:hypothetical protein